MAAKKSKSSEPQVRKVRRLRHWKQQYDENAAFLFRKVITWGEDRYEPGDRVPQKVIDEMGRNKLRRFWESNCIELAEFEAKTVPSATPKMDSAFLRGESNVMDQGKRDSFAEKLKAKLPKKAKDSKKAEKAE